MDRWQHELRSRARGQRPGKQSFVISCESDEFGKILALNGRTRERETFTAAGVLGRAALPRSPDRKATSAATWGDRSENATSLFSDWAAQQRPPYRSNRKKRCAPLA